jgi:hypothetical protein
MSSICTVAAAALFISCKGSGGPKEDAGIAESDATTPDMQSKVCDGSTAIRFWFANIAQGSRLLEGHALLEENGTSFFIVDGQCHFVSNAAAEGWTDYREGSLSAADAIELERSVNYRAWSTVAGKVWQNSDVQDASTLAFSNGSIWIGLRGWLTSSGLPELPAALWTWQNTMFAKLAAMGQPTTGSVRYRLFKREFFGVKYPTAAWPLPSDPSALAETGEDLAANAYGKGRLANAQETASLRALRHTYVQNHPGGFPLAVDFIPIGMPGDSVPDYLLFVRDTTSFESMTDGLIPALPRE